MKLNTIICFLLLVLSSSTYAEDTVSVTLDEVINKSLFKIIDKIKDTKGKVAVMDFPGLDGTSTGLSAYIANKAGNKLIEASRQVVDRSTLEKVISEQKLQQNSLMDAATAAKVGKLAGAGVFIVGNYTKTDTRFVLTIRALSVELGQFIPGAVAEETVRPLSAEFIKDISEFLNIKPLSTQQLDLNGTGSSSTDSTKAVDSAMIKKEIEFDSKVCKLVSPGIKIGKIYKLAFDLKYLTIDELKEVGSNDEIEDATGEKKFGYRIGNWAISNGGSVLTSDDIGAYVKGQEKNVGINKLEAWKYNGTHNFIGVEKCSPNSGWWNTKIAK